MNRPREWMETISHGGRVPLWLDLLLAVATPIQAWGMRRRLAAPRVKVPARVISYGNLTAGGTGKTPAVLERAMAELAAGRRVAVLTRGYGAPPVREPFLWTRDQPLDWRHIGDEAAMLARRLPDLIIARSRDRVAGARAAIERGADCLILDDGFQSVALERDENVLVINAANPFGNGFLLPRGTLREYPSAAARATHLLITHADRCADLDALINQLRRWCPHAPVRLTWHAPEGFERLADGSLLPPSAFHGREVDVLCAIGDPTGFFRLLDQLGARRCETMVLRDHAVLPSSFPAGARPLVMTEKDAARLNFHAVSDRVYVLRVRLADYAPAS
ncbi:MAG TPA: tetraacyldisaccharide 4'-kinase [Candidatus Hydrogenedentes bacterium]|nr:tetraacyldisaccharide 4'-kinase [Candidatus Hydrogenedentota bacterium]